MWALNPAAWTNNHLVNCRENEVKVFNSTRAEQTITLLYKEQRFTRHKSPELSILYTTPFTTVVNDTGDISFLLTQCNTPLYGSIWSVGLGLETLVTEEIKGTNAVFTTIGYFRLAV